MNKASAANIAQQARRNSAASKRARKRDEACRAAGHTWEFEGIHPTRPELHFYRCTGPCDTETIWNTETHQHH